jgi:hypothetical protein
MKTMRAILHQWCIYVNGVVWHAVIGVVFAYLQADAARAIARDPPDFSYSLAPRFCEQ